MLTRKDDDWYGACGKDIWFALVDYTEGFVFDYHFCVCKCGNATFKVDCTNNLDNEYVSRTCSRCNLVHWMIDPDEAARESIDSCGCSCGGEEFEVMGAVAPYLEPGEETPLEDTWMFYLGLRCVECGLTASYSEGFFEDDDPVAWLSVV